MFFRKDYAKPGPGIDRDEPEKTGAARLAEIFSIECVTLVRPPSKPSGSGPAPPFSPWLRPCSSPAAACGFTSAGP